MITSLNNINQQFTVTQMRRFLQDKNWIFKWRLDEFRVFMPEWYTFFIFYIARNFSGIW